MVTTNINDPYIEYKNKSNVSSLQEQHPEFICFNQEVSITCPILLIFLVFFLRLFSGLQAELQIFFVYHLTKVTKFVSGIH